MGAPFSGAATKRILSKHILQKNHFLITSDIFITIDSLGFAAAAAAASAAEAAGLTELECGVCLLDIDGYR